MSGDRITGQDSTIRIQPTLALQAQAAMWRIFGMLLQEVAQEVEEVLLDYGAPWTMFGQALSLILALMMDEI